MRHPTRPILPAGPALIVLAAVLSSCVTARVRPAPSQAVLEARAHRNVTATSACADIAAPLSVGFGFGESELSELALPAIAHAAETLACHPQATALILGEADGHGTEVDRQRLSQARADAVVRALRDRGVAQERLQVQAQGPTPTDDSGRLVILAEGRRW